VAEVITQVW